MGLSTQDNPGPGLLRILDQGGELIQRSLVDQRPDDGLLLKTLIHANSGDPFGDRFDESVMDAVLSRRSPSFHAGNRVRLRSTVDGPFVPRPLLAAIRPWPRSKSPTAHGRSLP